MKPAEQWAANKAFLDREIANGSAFRLASPTSAATKGTPYAKELAYLRSQGYRLTKDGLFMIKRVGSKICTGTKICF
jgi:hypothetical protein